jgi:DNA modification methylase
MSLAAAIKHGYINKMYAEDMAAHDWYRFVLSFPPHLVRDYIYRFKLNENSRVLDPFCGTGTTIVECKKQGVEGIGIESHPMLHFAGNVKINWSVNSKELLAHAHKIASAASQKLINCQSASKCFDLEENKKKLLLKDSISSVPLQKTLALIETINELKDEKFRAHEKLALAKALVHSISNLRFGPEVGIGKPKTDAPVIDLWLAEIKAIASDLDESLSESEKNGSAIFHADSRSRQGFLKPESIDACITSPPYPNEKDYTRTTRLETVLLDFVNDKAELQLLKRGLLRSNTRTVYKGDSDDKWISNNSEIKMLAAEIESRRIELGKTSGFEKLYSRVVELYFGGMTRHLTNLRPFLRSGAKLAYIVGDQASFFRIPIRTGKLLADIADSLGYEVVDIELFRSRLSTATKTTLREEGVILRWRGQHKYNSQQKNINSDKNEKIMSEEKAKTENRYSQIIEKVFERHYKKDDEEVKFTRSEFESIAKELNINLPKNLGDIIYSFRYRTQLPESITKTATKGKHWIIRPAGRGIYAFALAAEFDVAPNPNYDKVKIPDATPGLVTKYSLNDEQALLAKLRYNRLIDIFTGVTCYSLQNHLRTSIAGIGQVETDEIYVGVDKRGSHHVFPVQAKGGRDKLNIVQIEQDFALCASKFPELLAHPMGAQFMTDGSIALFEFKMTDQGVKIANEKHYKLVSPDEVTPELLNQYKASLLTD